MDNRKLLLQKLINEWGFYPERTSMGVTYRGTINEKQFTLYLSIELKGQTKMPYENYTFVYEPDSMERKRYFWYLNDEDMNVDEFIEEAKEHYPTMNDELVEVVFLVKASIASRIDKYNYEHWLDDMQFSRVRRL